MKIGAGKFKSICLELMEKVKESGEEIIITKHGEPVCKLVPIEKKVTHPLFGSMRDEVKILGDIVNPTMPAEEWTADWENVSGFVPKKTSAKSRKSSAKKAS